MKTKEVSGTRSCLTPIRMITLVIINMIHTIHALVQTHSRLQFHLSGIAPAVLIQTNTNTLVFV